MDPTVRHLAAPEGSLGLPRPKYEGRSVANIGTSVLRAVTGEEARGEPYAPPLDPSVDPFTSGKPQGTVVVLLVDGLGWGPFSRWTKSRSTPRGSRWKRLAKPITTVFPTTTTSALVSLSSGATPAYHGVVGYRQYLPAFGQVVDLLKMAPLSGGPPNSLVGPEWTPRLVSGAPTLFRRGARAVALTREAFRGSGFTRLLYDGAEFLGYVTTSHFTSLLAGVLSRSRPPPLVYAYWDELDTLQHLLGPSDEGFRFEIERVGHLIEYVAEQLPQRRRESTLLLVTGDHGQVSARPRSQVDLDRKPEILRRMSRPLAGDRRAGYFAARPGQTVALRDELEAILPTGSRVIGMEDAVAAGLFGPPPHHPELSDRLGDLLVLVPPPSGLKQTPPGVRKPHRFLLGAHGGLDPEELLVPLVAGSLADYL